MKAIVFDLDGTLVDSAPDIHVAANRFLTEYNCDPITLSETRSFIGHGIPNLVRQVMKVRDIDLELHGLAVSLFKELYAAKPSAHSKEYRGVTQLLRELRDQGFALGVCTNKDEPLSRQVLLDLELIQFFDVVVGGDTLPQRKPDPAPLNYAFDMLCATTRLYVGDSEVDGETACAAMVSFALFTEGYRTSAVSEIMHDFAFADYAEFPNLN